MIKIEKGIPFPRYTKNGRSTNRKYPWEEMEVGDSFFTEKKVGTMASAAGHAGERLGMKFATKSENNGTRVWRIK